MKQVHDVHRQIISFIMRVWVNWCVESLFLEAALYVTRLMLSNQPRISYLMKIFTGILGSFEKYFGIFTRVEGMWKHCICGSAHRRVCLHARKHFVLSDKSFLLNPWLQYHLIMHQRVGYFLKQKHMTI